MEEEKRRATLARKPESKKDQFKEDMIDIGARIGKEVIWPKVKDAISGAVDMVLYKEVRTRGNSNKLNVIDFTNYNAISTPQNQIPNPGVPVRNNYQAGSRNWRFEDVLFDSAEEATQVWYQLHDILQREYRLSINRYYDVCRADVQVPHTMEAFGWTYIGDSPSILQKQFGNDFKYIIAMPNIRNLGGR